MCIRKSLHTKILRSITYFEFSGIMVDNAGLNIRSRSVSMKVLGPGKTEMKYCSSTQVNFEKIRFGYLITITSVFSLLTGSKLGP